MLRCRSTARSGKRHYRVCEIEVPDGHAVPTKMAMMANVAA
jgi:hypothetical protein